jgi:hypothetical protein
MPQAAMTSECRMYSGVVRVVRHATPTASTSRSWVGATAAMTNENSPICASDRPTRADWPRPLPTKNDAIVTASGLTTSTTIVSATIAGAWASRRAGSMVMPTATKNTAANTSRNGRTWSNTSCEWPDSATSTPATNAPSATL